jgi:hypothetical protein
MKSKPFFIAAAVSIAIQGIIILVTNGISILAMSDLIDVFTNGQTPDPKSFTSPLIVGLGGISCFSCLIFPVIYMFTGWFYTFLHQREENLSLEISALGGAAASGVAGLVSGIFSGLVAIIITPFIYQSVANQVSPGMEFPSESINTISSSFGYMFSACWSALVAGGLGALGGLIGGALYNRQTNP